MDASDLVPIVCPTCATEFDVSRLPKGTKTACPKCRTIVVVPGASAPRPPVAVPPARVSPPPPSPLAPKRIEGSKKPPTNNVPVLAIVLAAVVFVGAGAGAFWFYGQQPRPVPQPASGPAPSRPASTVLPAARKNVALELRSRGWRQAPAFDVASALKHSLASAGVVVAASGSAPDARVVVEYEERRGASYTNGSTATVIEMQLDLEVGSARVLTLHGSGSSGGGPGSTEDSLYREALEAFQRSPGFVHGGSLVAGTLGVGDGSASIVDALLKRETRDLALDVLEKNGWQGSDARGRAALAAAREEYDACRSQGEASGEVLAEAFREWDDYDRAGMAKAMGELGAGAAAGAASRALAGYLRQAGSVGPGTERERRVQVAAWEALGKMGDEGALRLLSGVPLGEAPEVREAAERAAEAARKRLGK